MGPVGRTCPQRVFTGLEIVRLNATILSSLAGNEYLAMSTDRD